MRLRSFKSNFNYSGIGLSCLFVALLSACGGSGSGSSKTEFTTGCASGQLSWRANGGECVGTIAAGRPGAIQTARDELRAGDGYLGQADYTCNNGTWEVLSLEVDSTTQCEFVDERSMILSLAADGDGRWYDYVSDSFTEIGREWEGSQIIDGFFSPISAGDSAVTIGSGENHYPSEGDWQKLTQIYFYTEDYDGVGEYEAPITRMSSDLDCYVNGRVSILDQRYETNHIVPNARDLCLEEDQFPEACVDPLPEPVGYVLLLNNEIVGVEFTAATQAIWRGTFYGDISIEGVYSINRDGEFSIDIGEVTTPEAVALDIAGGDFSSASRWSYTGTVSNFFEVLPEYESDPDYQVNSCIEE
ncbi:MAG: hypothetical protein MI976_30500 [Pseudomonadales bacterium]|nr:hypothetical protein [Pseudomonadales bacterium]